MLELPVEEQELMHAFLDDAGLRVNVIDSDESEGGEGGNDEMGTLLVSLNPTGGKVQSATITSTDRTRYSFQLSFTYEPVGAATLSAFKAEELERAKQMAAEQAAHNAATAAAAAAAGKAKREAARIAAARMADIAALSKASQNAAADVESAKVAAAQAEEAAAAAAALAATSKEQGARSTAIAEAEAAAQAARERTAKSTLVLSSKGQEASQLAATMRAVKEAADSAAAMAKREAHRAQATEATVSNAAVKKVRAELAAATERAEMTLSTMSAEGAEARQAAHEARHAAVQAKAAATSKRRDVAELEDTAKAATKTIRISAIEAHELPDFDKEMGGGCSDPYVTFHLEADAGAPSHVCACAIPSVRTPTVENARSIRWAEVLELTVPGDLVAGRLNMTIFDDDSDQARVGAPSSVPSRMGEQRARDQRMGVLAMGIGPEGKIVDRATVISLAKSRYAFRMSFTVGSFASTTSERMAASAAAEYAEAANEAATRAATLAAAAEAKAAGKEAAAIGVQRAALQAVLEAAEMARGVLAEEVAALSAAAKAADRAAAKAAAFARTSWSGAAQIKLAAEATTAATVTAVQDMKDAASALSTAQAEARAALCDEKALDSAAMLTAAQAKAAVAKLAEVEAKAAALDAAKQASCRWIHIGNVEAIGLPDTDKQNGEGTCDPYVRFELISNDGVIMLASARTETVMNARDVVWSEALAMKVPFDVMSGRIRVTVMDEDGPQRDEPVGILEFEVDLDRLVVVDRATVFPIDKACYAFRVSFSYECYGPSTSGLREPEGVRAKKAAAAAQDVLKTANALALVKGELAADAARLVVQMTSCKQSSGRGRDGAPSINRQVMEANKAEAAVAGAVRLGADAEAEAYLAVQAATHAANTAKDAAAKASAAVETMVESMHRAKRAAAWAEGELGKLPRTIAQTAAARGSSSRVVTMAYAEDASGRLRQLRCAPPGTTRASELRKLHTHLSYRRPPPLPSRHAGAFYTKKDWAKLAQPRERPRFVDTPPVMTMASVATRKDFLFYQCGYDRLQTFYHLRRRDAFVANLYAHHAAAPV